MGTISGSSYQSGSMAFSSSSTQGQSLDIQCEHQAILHDWCSSRGQTKENIERKQKITDPHPNRSNNMETIMSVNAKYFNIINLTRLTNYRKAYLIEKLLIN